MIVCLCKQVSCKDIRSAAGNGAQSLRDLSRELGVATQCGKCAQCARGILEESLQGESPSAAHAAA
ncbi:MAG: (2Fe-2S)-binding protein [Gammaproteobacteria bacterium]|jgi:bacterioferritin-associated ferredoxin